MKKKNLLLVFLTFFAFSAYAQYCSPTFSSGCSSWRNQAISLDSIQWTIGSTACTTSDYTYMRTTLQKGVAKSMSVTNGSWCGVGVWVDYNGDFVFDPDELLYNSYQAAATQTYNFTITVPSTAANGTYRMRVIAGWGTDCVTTGGNGNGPCGAYQYGNFDDFSIKVVGTPVGMEENAANASQTVIISPNPATDQILVQADAALIHSAYTLTDQFGRKVMGGIILNENTHIDISELASGIYFFNASGKLSTSVKVVKH